MSITLYSALMNYRKKQQYLKKVFGSEYYTYHFEGVVFHICLEYAIFFLNRLENIYFANILNTVYEKFTIL